MEEGGRGEPPIWIWRGDEVAAVLGFVCKEQRGLHRAINGFWSIFFLVKLELQIYAPHRVFFFLVQMHPIESETVI